MWIFRAWITGRDGEKIYAKDHGSFQVLGGSRARAD